MSSDLDPFCYKTKGIYNFPSTRTTTKPKHLPVSTGFTSNVSPVKKLPVEIVEDESPCIPCLETSELKFVDTALESAS